MTALLVKTVQGVAIGEEATKFLLRNLPRHKCVACGTGGHRRRMPVFIAPTGARFRPTSGA